MNRSKRILLSIAFASFLPVSVIAGPVDVNSANAETISAELKGVGLTKANAIVDYRNEHGAFEAAEDLVQVKGIGARTVEINQENIRLKPLSK